MIDIKVGDKVKTVNIEPRFVCSNYKGDFQKKFYQEWIVVDIRDEYIYLRDKYSNTLTCNSQGLGDNLQIYKINNVNIS